MIARLRSVWFAINASYWFYPALFATSAFLLALGLIYADRSGGAEWLTRIDAFNPARPEGASNMLTVLAGSMIGVASTVFSITIAAVAYASGTYGPRLLTNFMEDKGNQLSLATFIGTFVYSLTVLRAVRTGDEMTEAALGDAADAVAGFVPQLSLLVAFGMMVIAVGVLVYFLHHIPSSIRINAVLEGIGSQLLSIVDKRYPQDHDGSENERERPEGASVLARKTGYIRVIDLSELANLAQEHDLAISLEVRAGDFLHPGKPLLRVSRETIEDDIAGKLRGCFALGGSRTPEQDLEFSIDELVEIALRALSPGINDPFTAITAIHWLGAATASLGARDLRERIGGRDPDACMVMPLDDGFAHFVRRGFGAARAAIASNRLAAAVCLDALRDAAVTLDDPQRRALLEREGHLLLAQAQEHLAGPDLEEIRTRHRQFSEDLARRG